MINMRTLWMMYGCLLSGMASQSCLGPGGGLPQSAGGSGGMGVGPDIQIVSHSRNGSDLTIEVESSEALRNIWAPSCGTAPRLLKKVGDAWTELQDDRPKEGTLEPYYLDGTYVPNESLGCDGGNSCYEVPLRTAFTISTLEYVAVGTRTPPEPGASGLGDGAIPDIASRDTTGPYQFELRYMPVCVSDDIQSVRLDVP